MLLSFCNAVVCLPENPGNNSDYEDEHQQLPMDEIFYNWLWQQQQEQQHTVKVQT